MVLLLTVFLAVAQFLTFGNASHAERAAAPTVIIDGATFRGVTTNSIAKFLGIPFAKPPVGDLRFRLPVPFTYINGTFDASEFGPSCPQQSIRLPLPPGLVADAVNAITDSIFQLILPDSEDCLTINVVRPRSIPAGTKLPVVVWIFGGGFELGSTSMYDGGVIVERSLDMNQPVVYVSMNYRPSAFGFLSSKEIQEAGVGNLGLQDQREALRWIQKYISNFGGDANKVTIWGESAGAISVALQLLANGGDPEGLFHAAFMQSGSPIPVGDITHGQKYYDFIVQEVGCANAADTLACLRTVPYEALHKAMDDSPDIFSYQALSLAWLPRTDGVFLKDNPQRLVAQGSVARVPIVTGDCDDEGTLFSLTNLNVSTEAETFEYVKTFFAPTASDAEITAILKAYPADITQGSPYGTGIFNALSPEFKRLASLQGDVVFQAPRRYFMNQIAGKQDVWVFINKRLKALPVLGSFHGSDIPQVYGGAELTSYLVSFANTFNPNYRFGFSWPKWDPSGKKALIIQDGLFPLEIGADNFRENGFQVLTNLSLNHPL